jgi:hypothetical protein
MVKFCKIAKLNIENVKMKWFNALSQMPEIKIKNENHQKKSIWF